MNNYGRRGRHGRSRQKRRVNFNVFIGIILLAVLAGFLTTRFVVYPLVLQINPDMAKGNVSEQQGENREQQPDEAAKEPEPSVVQDKTNEQEQASSGGIVVDKLEVKEAGAGYAVQFGSFSTKEAAEMLIEQLKSSGINAQIMEKDGAYKVLGQLFADKQKALELLKTIDRTIYKDVFVTQN